MAVNGIAMVQASNLYYDGTNWRYQTAGAGSLYVITNGEHYFYVAAASTAGAIATLIQAAKFDVSGNVLATAASLGYGSGAGGTVTQATSKSTTVSLDKPVGRITMNAASLAASTTVGFSFNCSFIQATDNLLLTIVDASVSSSQNYNLWASVGGGGALIRLRNISAGALAEAVQINYAVIKGAIA